MLQHNTTLKKHVEKLLSMHKIMLFIIFEFEYLHRKIQCYKTKSFII